MSNAHPAADHLLADALPEGVVILDANGCMVWWSDMASSLLGLLRNLNAGQHIDTVINYPVFDALMKSASLQLSLPAKPRHQFQFYLHPYHESQTVLIIQDITLTYRLEAMRREFVANVSHELRTPLTVFQGYLELLRENTFDRAQLSEIISQMEGQAMRMHQLVEDLLLLSRLESVEPDEARYQAVPVASLLKDIVQDAQSLSGQKAHQFTMACDDSLFLQGDPEELRSAFSNLVYNAVHYTPAGGHITVRWYETETTSIMAVEDTGIGIAEKHIPRLTQRFYQVDKARAKNQGSRGGGTGLGLALVKHVMLRHGGDVEIESELGKGSVFRCVFPNVKPGQQ